MRILVVCQHYWPEPFNVTDVCEGLAARGHDVTVLTGLPNTGLPGNEVPEGYRRHSVSKEARNGVRVLRVPLHPRRSGARDRVLNYLSFWRNGNRAARRIEDKFDVVLGYQFSPVMQVDPGLAYAHRHGVRMLLYCFDLWPASLLAGGFSKRSLPYRWMREVSTRIYSQADRIAVTSPLFDEYFRNELSLRLPDSAYIPQFAEDSFLSKAEPVGEGFEQGLFHVTFAGNVGRVQSVETVVRAAALLGEGSGVVFHIVGSGSSLGACESLARELGAGNVVFHGRRPLEEMPAYYAASDAMVVTFADGPVARYTLPRKVQSYLAAGKPVIAAADGETRRVVEGAGCGLCCGFGDAASLAEAARRLSEAGDLSRLGRRARSYYEANFTREMFFERLERELEILS